MRLNFQCETCGKAFSRYPSSMTYDPPRFCSTACFYKWLKGSERTPRITTPCKTCGQEFRIRKTKYDAGQGRYCSQKCMIQQRPTRPKKIRAQFTCLHCGKVFYKLNCQTKNGRGKFCSRRCLGAYTVRNARNNRPTTIEQLLADELERRDLAYESQYPITGWVLDFAFPSHRLAVEADGDYWHSLENVIEKDARKDADLIQQGWAIIHLAEHDIRKSPSDCVDQIVAHLSTQRP